MKKIRKDYFQNTRKPIENSVSPLSRDRRDTGKNPYINKILFFLFIFLLPTQLGKHFFFPFSYLYGVRVDFLAPTLYMIDLVVLATAIANIKTVLNFFKRKSLLIFLVLICFNISFSFSKQLAVYGSLRILEFLIVFSLGPTIVKVLKEKSFLVALIMSSAVEIFLSVYQIVYKQSFQQIFYFLGERLISLDTPGIAKIDFNQVQFMRPYGTFSHPNSLAGFYLLSYFFVLTRKEFDKHHFLKYLFLFASTILVFLSFSKGAIFVYISLNTFYWATDSRVSCGLCRFSRIVTPLVIGSIFFLIGRGDPLTLDKRIELAYDSLMIITKHPLFGVGIGNYLIAQSHYPSHFPLFFNQPVHNIFLLLIAEVGTFIFVYVFWSIGKKLWDNRTKIDIGMILVGLVVFMTGLFDHYWLTLIQNYLLMGTVFSISFGEIFLSRD